MSRSFVLFGALGLGPAFALALALVSGGCDSGGNGDGDVDGDGDADDEADLDTDADADAGADADPDADADADDDPDADPDEAPDLWVTAYLASWNHYVEPGGAWGHLRTEEIDCGAFTHLVYFAVPANADGSVGPIEEWENVNPDRVREIVPAAHAAGVPVLLGVGGAGNAEFAEAIRPATRDLFVAYLAVEMCRWGFDGIDVDMEPIGEGDLENYRELIRTLHAALAGIAIPGGYPDEPPIVSRPLLTAAVSWQPALFADLQMYLDQINIMTYDMSGPWPGWVTWHNSPLHDGGFTFYSTGGLVPSVEGVVGDFLAAGVRPGRLGIGLDFYGYRWQGGRLYDDPSRGVSEPRQRWADGQAPAVESNVPYHVIATTYGLGPRDESHPAYRWDDVARVPYLSLSDGPADEHLFLSYDNERSLEEKVAFARALGLGGAIIWELGGGFLESRPAGERAPLLQAVRAAALSD